MYLHDISLKLKSTVYIKILHFGDVLYIPFVEETGKDYNSLPHIQRVLPNALIVLNLNPQPSDMGQ